jgi:PAS domain S-box-containing protein
MDQEKGGVIHRCKHSLIDFGAPVIVEGKHIANVFGGQFFTERPDMEFFKKRAGVFGFDEADYLEAVREVPVHRKRSIKAILEYLEGFAQLLSDMAQGRMRQMEGEVALRESEKKYRSIFENAAEGIFQARPEGRYSDVNPAFASMLSYADSKELMTRVTNIRGQQFVKREDAARFEKLLRENGRVHEFETQFYKKNGRKTWLSVNARVVNDRCGGLFYEGTAKDITKQKEAEQATLAARERLQSLSRSLLQRMEAERHLLAYELHDEIGQVLTAVRINVDSVRRLADESERVSRIDESIDIIDKALGQVRALSLNLRPSMLDDLGLVVALRWLADSVSRAYPVSIKVDPGPIRTRLDAEVETTCFRVAQEAVTNAVRHAKPRDICISVKEQRNRLYLRVSNDGAGFNVKLSRKLAVRGESFGLLGMEERVLLCGGVFRIVSRAGRGTQIAATFPLKKGDVK